MKPNLSEMSDMYTFSILLSGNFYELKSILVLEENILQN